MDIKQTLKKNGRLAAELDLVWGTSGNMSLRIDEDSFLITTSGASLGNLQDEEMIICQINDDLVKGKPSMEFRMHKQIYLQRKEIMAVLHSQPLFSTLAACAKNLEIKTQIIPESIVYLKKIERVPYQHPGSLELALAVGEKIKNANILLLENHGVVCAGDSIEEVINKTQTLEFLCKLIIFSKSANIELRPIASVVLSKFCTGHHHVS
ncbi:MAG: class II aldolase/adducin family protein [bacterium]